MFMYLLKKHTSVDPVNATLSISIWLAMAAPVVGPNPGTIFTTPGGKPACMEKILTVTSYRQTVF